MCFMAQMSFVSLGFNEESIFGEEAVYVVCVGVYCGSIHARGSVTGCFDDVDLWTSNCGCSMWMCMHIWFKCGCC